MRPKIELGLLHPIALLLSFLAGLVIAGNVQADDFTPNQEEDARFVEYERQLNAILKTRLDGEKIFVAKVVTLVREGKIPAKLVNTSFQWVRQKRPDTNYPFVYFERVLRLQAGRLELAELIPDFDYSIYRSVGQQEPESRGLAGQFTELRNKLRSALTPGTRR